MRADGMVSLATHDDVDLVGMVSERLDSCRQRFNKTSLSVHVRVAAEQEYGDIYR